ncbi:MAG: amidohydrolase [Deltaproteobacteria bacterium]|nr:MAG: amidohydrolase [Deltaproteobacteria bacterium]
MHADTLLFNGRIHTMDHAQPTVEAVAIRNGRFLYVGNEQEAMSYVGPQTRKIDLQKKTVIPGLNDSHTHLIRGGLSYNMELRWEGVSSLGDALEMLRIQAENTPAPQWVRVIGGWSEFQFKERRMPTLAEINQAAPHTPVIILHLYGRALLNQAALRALGYDKNPPTYDRGVVERDSQGNPTGMLIADPSALVLYATISQAPKLPLEDQKNSTRHFMRELNRLGITSVIDAGGGGQNYPEDYQIIQELADEGKLTVRIAYNLFAQVAGKEYDDYARWVDMTRPGHGDDMLRLIGAGENLVWSAADFENFLKPRPDLSDEMAPNLEKIIRLLAERRWPFRIHATYDESIQQFLNVFESVNKDVPLHGMPWIIDHAETISEASMERIRALGGGVAIQHRMAFQGEYFVDRYGKEAAQHTPPIRKMLQMGLPVGAGTDATRVASYNPWVCLYWLTTGRTLGGLSLYGDDNLLSRDEALRLWTVDSSWFSSESGRKGAIQNGQHADLVVLSADYFSIPDEDIKNLEAEMTLVGGNVVYGKGSFSDLDPGIPPVSPGWSPVGRYGGHQRFNAAITHSNRVEQALSCCGHSHSHGHSHGHHGHHHGHNHQAPTGFDLWGLGAGCACWAF